MITPAPTAGCRWREGQISHQELQALSTPIRQAFKAKLEEVSDLGFAKGEKTPWASTVRTCRQMLKVGPALWTYLQHPELVAPRTNAAVEEVFSAGGRALRAAVIHRKLSYGVQSQQVGLCQRRLLTVMPTLKQQGRDELEFLVVAWEVHRDRQPAASLLPQRD